QTFGVSSASDAPSSWPGNIVPVEACTADVNRSERLKRSGLRSFPLEQLVGVFEPGHGAFRVERLFGQGFRIPLAAPGGVEEIAAVDVKRPGQARNRIG